MTKYESLWAQIDANTSRLHAMGPSDPEYKPLVDETAGLILDAGEMTIGEAQEEVK